MWPSNAQIYTSVTRYKKQRKISLDDFISCILLALSSGFCIGIVTVIVLIEKFNPVK
jgi:hypothetical protein